MGSIVKCAICNKTMSGNECCGIIVKNVATEAKSEYHESNLLNSIRLKIVKKYYPQGNLLDVGAGLGGFLILAKNAGYDCEGCEIDKSRYEIAKKRGVSITLKELTKFNKKFDIITFFECLQYIPNFKETLIKAKNSLNDSGKVFIELPNLNSYYYFAIKLVYGKHPLLVNGMNIIFRQDGIKSVLKSAGFSKIRIVPGSPDEIFPNDNWAKKCVKRGLHIMCQLLFEVTGILITNSMMVIAEK